LAIAKTTTVDIMLIASIAVSILMSAIVVSKAISDQPLNMYSSDTGRSLSPAQSNESAAGGREGSTTQESPPTRGTYSGGAGLSPPVDDGEPAQGSASPHSAQPNPDATFYSPVYDSAQYILPITWGAVGGTLIWRGKVRSAWSRQGYDYDTFRLVARMRGSPVRVKLLKSVVTAKNRLQLANEFDVDWKTIHNHMEILTKSGLFEEKAVVGTTRYYTLTEHGRRILLLLAERKKNRHLRK
jgi:predicted transcriptional regulator